MSKNHYLFISIDFETLGLNTSTAPILSLGAHPFMYIGSRNIMNRSYVVKYTLPYVDNFYSVCNYKDQQNRFIEQGTLDFWDNQQDKSIIKQSEDSDIKLENLLQNFKTWFEKIASSIANTETDKEEGINVIPIILGNGATFDNALLEYVFKQHNIAQFWSYKHSLCIRTLYSAAPYKPDASPVLEAVKQTKYILKIKGPQPHNALYDSVFQGQKLLQLYSYEFFLNFIQNL